MIVSDRRQLPDTPSDAPLTVRTMLQRDLRAVSKVCIRAFRHSVAATLSREGGRTFARVTRPKAFAERMQNDNLMFVAEKAGRVVGVIELKEGRHIAMFFIEPDCQRQGVGRRLLDHACLHTREPVLTVNASLTSVSAYQRFGFQHNGEVDESGGLVYQPMQITLNGVLGRN